MVSNNWTTVATMQVIPPSSTEPEDVSFDQCPECSALVWSVNRGHHEQWHARSVWERCTATATNMILAGDLTVHCKLPAHHDGKHYATRAQPPYPDVEYEWPDIDGQDR
ncbi:MULTISPECIES: hypothetical protein [unclassified Rhodococcus (in: high G+C Gram-positive bacteria)]|uniref:hypothetical protein n=1 Tax=unclassified Rhodococcus (in: high G+C Gram-positive bacteria) TaxID=192944 RepID=UPI000B9C5F4D|nr:MULTISPECIES: hypothetical protein [unclassified Rhodococcus (in: high G+C Gram-positive bacteria)]OZE35618.1 hypothetical protein CH259_16460 [Rhodococcus sp. 05-2254-4]OZE48047.1 hypothetical protein CH261_09055 [Rhodococcus sp. 05-2254-3]OZE49258.1 hypothetical protein CH283_16840 [Rhodococcus sp. 05-2254-2]